MSGGRFEYREFQLQMLADEIECYIDSNFIDKDWDEDYDMLESCNETQREVVMSECVAMVHNLRELSTKIKHLDYYLSGDIGIETFLKRINEIKL